jgi:hypothetical protein
MSLRILRCLSGYRFRSLASFSLGLRPFYAEGRPGMEEAQFTGASGKGHSQQPAESAMRDHTIEDPCWNHDYSRVVPLRC